MTWCLQASNFDVDVDLLFQENSTIGQKMLANDTFFVLVIDVHVCLTMIVQLVYKDGLWGDSCTHLVISLLPSITVSLQSSSPFSPFHSLSPLFPSLSLSFQCPNRKDRSCSSSYEVPPSFGASSDTRS